MKRSHQDYAVHVTIELIVIHRSLPLMVLSTQSCVNRDYVDSTQSSMELIEWFC